MDCDAAMDRGRKNAESGEADEGRRFGTASVDHAPNHAARMDVLHDRQESGQTRHL